MGPKIFVLPTNERFIVLGAVLLLWIAIRVVAYLISRGKTPGAIHDYGIGGGAICPKCGRPFALSLLGIKMGFGSKLVRCPHCGKWSIARPASPEALRAAEEAEQAGNASVREKTEEEKLQEMVDNSRYSDK